MMRCDLGCWGHLKMLPKHQQFCIPSSLTIIHPSKVRSHLLSSNLVTSLVQESASLADKLIQDQVTRAQEAEDTYALKNELSVTRHQLTETQKKLEAAEDIIGDIRRRVRKNALMNGVWFWEKLISW